LIFRNEDLDPQRCRAEFVEAMFDDLHWLGIQWQEGPDCGGPVAPYTQSARRDFYLDAWQRLRDAGTIYPCICSRKDLVESATAPNETDDEVLYSGHCRSRNEKEFDSPAGVNWRFRVPDGRLISFNDLNLGAQQFQAGRDFGDFVIWRRDDVPAYQLAVVVDDAAMLVTEVVRGADLLKSTARQVLLANVLLLPIPAYHHCELVRDRRASALPRGTTRLAFATSVRRDGAQNRCARLRIHHSQNQLPAVAEVVDSPVMNGIRAMMPADLSKWCNSSFVKSGPAALASSPLRDI